MQHVALIKHKQRKRKQKETKKKKVKGIPRGGNAMYSFFSIFSSRFFLLLLVGAILLQVKKVPRAGHFDDQIFFSLEPSLSTMPLSSTLSQLHTLCVAQLLLTPQIICWRSTLLNL